MKKRGKVFLLDDEELIVTVLAKTLKAENYEVFSENDCEGAIKKIRAFNPDVVLLDIRMPSRSGIERASDAAANPSEVRNSAR